MRTKIIKIGPEKIDNKKICIAAGIIKHGGLVAFPTETVYGLGANALDTKAVRKIFRAKKRPHDDPLIVHISSERQLYSLAEKVDVMAKALAEKFWPGPLTLVMKKSRIVPLAATGGLNTVAVRMPRNSIALSLIEAAGTPIAAPSANMFGRPSPTQAKHVIEDLGGRIDAVIDGGDTKIGIESTVLDLSGKIPMLLRPGKITLEQLKAMIGKILVHPLVKTGPMGKKLKGNATEINAAGKKSALKSPGIKYRHYAPKAKVILIEGPAGRAAAKIKKIKAGFSGKKVVALKTSGVSKSKIASSLFSNFREADRKGAEVILVQGVDENGLGLAVMNRVRKAATRIIKA